MQAWLCPGSSVQQATKAKRKLYCGEHAMQNNNRLLQKVTDVYMVLPWGTLHIRLYMHCLRFQVRSNFWGQLAGMKTQLCKCD